MRRAKKIGIVCVGILMIVFMFLSYSNLFGGETERDITKISVIGIKRKNSQVEDFKRGIEENPKAVEDVRSGKGKAIGALVGQTMKATQGKANPAVVNKLLKELL